ncbi:M23 family metallopeptidase [Balneola sp. MJW-20]|uniref:M23 family metallopeptidase n=1 Tax=Gracilimonas aurantiaca TaxID=3234185 RepID=UPI0034657D21
MLDFLKKLLEKWDKHVTLIVMDDSRPGEDNSFDIAPKQLFGFMWGVSVLFAVIVALVFMLTPLGALLYNTDDAEIREQILAISEKTAALEDSLQHRDMQLREMKNVIRLSMDTTMAMDQRLQAMFDQGGQISDPDLLNFDNSEIELSLSQNEVLFSNVINSVAEFPSRAPVEGTLTRGYLPKDQHYGIDIATKENEPVRNIADGSVFNSGWTINNGFMISIQHNDGIISTYKHLSRLNKQEGDLVLKGDIIGITGNTGVLSTGPHLHFEIWKDGIPQNPEYYIIH